MGSLKDRYCIVGVGETEYSRNSARSTRAMAVDAVKKAMADAGRSFDKIDGVAAAATVWIWPLILLMVHGLLGPTCVTRLQTAVSTEDLPSLARQRRLRRALARLLPRIEAAQGRIAGDELLAAPEIVVRAPAPPRPAPAPRPAPPGS